MLSTGMLRKSPFVRQKSFIPKANLSSRARGSRGIMGNMYIRQQEFLNASRRNLPSIRNIQPKKPTLSPGISKLFFNTSLLKKSLNHSASNVNKIMKSISYNPSRGFMSSAYKGSFINTVS